MKNHTPSALKRARQQRRQMSLPEVLLWKELKQRPGNYKFRKLHPIGEIVVDFYCDRAKLVIEVDGISHDMGDQPQADIRRDRWLNGQGIEVLRIPADEVLDDLDPVVRHITAVATRRIPPPSPAFAKASARATSPDGGGF